MNKKFRTVIALSDAFISIGFASRDVTMKSRRWGIFFLSSPLIDVCNSMRIIDKNKISVILVYNALSSANTLTIKCIFCLVILS